MPDVPTIGDLETVFGNVIKVSLAFAAIVLFVMIVAGALKHITSGADPKAAQGARNTITYAIGGLVALLLSYMILLLIKTITGVDVTTFKLIQ